MTNQETFDFICKAVIAQGKPASDGQTCFYRTADGLKCAAGHLMTDEEHDKLMALDRATLKATATKEGIEYKEMPLTGTVTSNPHIIKFLENKGYNVSLVRSLQHAHDGSSRKPDFLGSFKAEAREVAIRNGLSTAVLD